MSMKSRWQKGFSSVFLVLFLLFTCAVFMNLKMRTDRISRKRIAGSSLIYVPSGKFLKFVTFGYSSLMADLIYLWAIQYYGDTTIQDRFDYLEHIFSIISELDPRYIDPYDLGAIIALYEARNLELALKILDWGLARNPDQWFFPFQAGHYAQFAGNFEAARAYYQKATEIEGVPAIAKRLYANAAFKVMDLQTSWETWKEVYETAEDPQIKKYASNHLYQVKAAADILVTKEALARFKEKFSRYPTSLSQVVRAGFLTSLPQDLDGDDYVYNSQTGEVKAPKVWWKR